eukprot:CAMPEP_0198291962 /NCGR_PEP_ID=MMETSP1449-20131203/9284_1 /TAXON_ID=420275 /ORGANISM="Attheya septentrionalis, Strain CCMP2084" /LENGTH=500 /DNA_ID=CAMNT_0043990649 /DNA_START=116 /DNA_END=1618 /DNA_ORIENTATION=+
MSSDRRFEQRRSQDSFNATKKYLVMDLAHLQSDTSNTDGSTCVSSSESSIEDATADNMIHHSEFPTIQLVDNIPDDEPDSKSRRMRHGFVSSLSMFDSSEEIDSAETSSRAPLVSDHHLVLFGYDISEIPPRIQFGLCATGVFSFTIVYGYLQELLAIQIAGRKFALFLGTCQFFGYALGSLVLSRLGSNRKKRVLPTVRDCITRSRVPSRYYIALSLLRAVDLGMTNSSMKYLNYPAKTLIKSSRVFFTMILGIFIGKKKYGLRDYALVSSLVLGLAIFLHADATSSVVFHPAGVIMLVISLICDAALNNWSEVIMNRYEVSQDTFQLNLYSIAFLAMAIAAHVKGELISGVRHFMLMNGTVEEIESGEARLNPSWTATNKILILVLFASTGLLGSSCAGAITKRFGALSMSLTSTARKGMTIILSFVLFPNKCTLEHIFGMMLFLGSLIMKSLGSHGRIPHTKKTPVKSVKSERNQDHEQMTALLKKDCPPSPARRSV